MARLGHSQFYAKHLEWLQYVRTAEAELRRTWERLKQSRSPGEPSLRKALAKERRLRKQDVARTASVQLAELMAGLAGATRSEEHLRIENRELRSKVKTLEATAERLGRQLRMMMAGVKSANQAEKALAAPDQTRSRRNGAMPSGGNETR
jgi:predicted  nucleic acid-binding Zn-ribbon protein